MSKPSSETPGDESAPEGRGAADDARIDRVPDGEEAWRLLDSILDGQASEADRQRLEQLAVANPAVARLCLRTVHLWYGMQLHTCRTKIMKEIGLEFEDEPNLASDIDSLNETMILPVLREPELQSSEFDDLLSDSVPVPLKLPRRQPARTARRTWAVAAIAAIAAAAALVVTTGIVWRLALRHEPTVVVADRTPTPVVAPTPVPIPPAAVITATAGAVIDGASAPPRTEVALDRTLRLTAGAVEVTFASGAVATILAPTEFRVVGPNALALDSGSIVAQVPPPAVGFKVLAPGLSVVDHGTNFGVRAREGGVAETAVFQGVVEAFSTDASKRPIAAPPVRLTAGQAVRRDPLAGDAGPVAISFAPETYTHNIRDLRVPLPPIDAGAKVGPDGIDPAWQIISGPGDDAATTRPAFLVSKLASNYTKAYPGRHWVSVGTDLPEVPNGDYVFRTVLDLTGYDPATVALAAEAVADNELIEVRANGTKMAVKKVGNQKINSYLLNLSGLKWSAGRNEIDFVLRNTADRNAPASPMALSINLTGTALPSVNR